MLQRRFSPPWFLSGAFPFFWNCFDRDLLYSFDAADVSDLKVVVFKVQKICDIIHVASFPDECSQLHRRGVQQEKQGIASPVFLTKKAVKGSPVTAWIDPQNRPSNQTLKNSAPQILWIPNQIRNKDGGKPPSFCVKMIR